MCMSQSVVGCYDMVFGGVAVFVGGSESMDGLGFEELMAYRFC